jgi:large subunit ribosomal protein L18
VEILAMGATGTGFGRRKARVRKSVRRAANGRPRLSVFRSSKHIYAQVIDDADGRTLASASSLDKELRGQLKTGADAGAAAEVGKVLAQRAVAAGVKEVVFDRGGYIYHGRVKALADAAREGGLSF